MSNSVKTRFFSAIEQGRIPHACFIACADIYESYTTAKQAASLFCTGSIDTERISACPDFFELSTYSVDAVRELLKSLVNQPYSDKYGRAVIFSNAHEMNEESQNALLKTLEEPPRRTLFLITGNESGLLPTIRSRCSMVRLKTPSCNETADKLSRAGASEKEAFLYAALGEGLYDRASKLYFDESFRALRDNSVAALISFLSGKLQFDILKPLCANKSASEAVTFMLSFMRDILLLKMGGTVFCNTDKRADLASFCDRFTIRQINSIIDIMTDTKSRLALCAVQAPVIDRMFTKISEEI